MIMLRQTSFLDEASARDTAASQVVDNAGIDWREKAIQIVRGLPMAELTGEDIRLACIARGVEPHHHNAWGGLTLKLIRDGVLVPTERYRAMQANGSHARKTPVYRKV